MQHDGVGARSADADRDAALVAAAGIHVLRIPAHAVRHDAERVVARLRAVRDAAAARAAAS